MSFRLTRSRSFMTTGEVTEGGVTVLARVLTEFFVLPAMSPPMSSAPRTSCTGVNGSPTKERARWRRTY